MSARSVGLAIVAGPVLVGQAVSPVNAGFSRPLETGPPQSKAACASPASRIARPTRARASHLSRGEKPVDVGAPVQVRPHTAHGVVRRGSHRHCLSFEVYAV